MVKYSRKFGITVECYIDDTLVHKEHFIATDPDMVRKLAYDYIERIQYDYDSFAIIDREVMTPKEQFAH